MQGNKAITSGCPIARGSHAILLGESESNLSHINQASNQNTPVNRITNRLANLRDFILAASLPLAAISLHDKIVENTPLKFKNYMHLGFLGLALAAFLLKNKTFAQPVNEIDNEK